MPPQRHLPDRKLVYLHCSPIFRGPNALLRKKNTILRLLQERQSTIQILTSQYPLQDIADVAQGLLKDKIFESLTVAKVRLPELFQLPQAQLQPPQAKVAERAAPDVGIARVETQTARDTALTSDKVGQGGVKVDSRQSHERHKKQDAAVIHPHEVTILESTRTNKTWQVFSFETSLS